MLTRRAVMIGMAFSMSARPSLAKRREVITFLQIPPLRVVSPSIIRADGGVTYSEPTRRQVARTREILESMPRGPRPVDIAQAFVDRYYRQDPSAITQLPPPGPRNPLISEFLKITGAAANDIVPWCAAFANFCIVRSGLAGSASASSQSFLSPPFQQRTVPREGDLAVFTCFDLAGRSIGLGHVAFFKEPVDENHIRIVGGNQSADGHSSIICESTATTTSNRVKRRTPAGAAIEATMRLSAYVRID